MNLREVAEAFVDRVERAEAHWDWKLAGRPGMQVPFHDDFGEADRMPSLAGRLRWWAREFKTALEGQCVVAGKAMNLRWAAELVRHEEGGPVNTFIVKWGREVTEVKTEGMLDAAAEVVRRTYEMRGVLDPDWIRVEVGRPDVEFGFRVVVKVEVGQTFTARLLGDELKEAGQ